MHWSQIDIHSNAIAVLQDVRLQDEQQLIHQSLTQNETHWGSQITVYPIRFRSSDGL